MKKIDKKTLLFTLGIVVSSISFGQKLMETSAASEYENKFVKAYGKRDLTGASEAILKAKEFIDQASTNDETKNNPKTQYYKAQIYLGLVDITKTTSNDPVKIKEYQEVADANLLSTFNNPNTKYKEKVEEYVNQKADRTFNNGVLENNAKHFLSAMLLFLESNQIKNTIGRTMENAEKYAEICYATTVFTYYNQNKLDSSEMIIKNYDHYFPKNKQVSLTKIDIQLKKGNLVEMDKLTEDYVNTNPTDSLNKRLYYNLATTYLNNNDFVKAEVGFKKALALDGMYIDALYQLANTYISISRSLFKEASLLSSKDPKSKTIEDQAKKTLLSAIYKLEKYTAVAPNDKEALLVLSRAYGRLENEEKAAEIKAKADAIK